MAIPDLIVFPISTTDNTASESQSGLCPALSGEVAPFNMTGLTIPPPATGVYTTPKTNAVVSELGLRRAIRRHYDDSVTGVNLGTGTGKPFRDSSNKIIKTRGIVSLTDKIKVYEELGNINLYYDNTSFTADLGYVQGGVYQMWGAEFFTAGVKSTGAAGTNTVKTRSMDPALVEGTYKFDIAIAKICVRIPRNKAFKTADNNKKIHLGLTRNTTPPLVNYGKFGYFLTRDAAYIEEHGEWVPFVTNPFYGRIQYEYLMAPETGPYTADYQWEITATIGKDTSAPPNPTTITFDADPITGLPTSGFEVYIFYDMVRYS